MWIIKIKLADVNGGLQSLIYLAKCLRSQQMCAIIIIPMRLEKFVAMSCLSYP